MRTIDLKAEFKHLYNPSSKTPIVVDVPSLNFLMIDGHGNPNTAQAYADALNALYAVSYTLKFMLKKGEDAIDYPVMPLEGLWWADSMDAFGTDDSKDAWEWTSMIMQPAFITSAMVEDAIAQAPAKKDLPALSKMRFERFVEGVSAQVMHIGPFAAEGPTIARLHAFITESGHTLRGKHHEIYLSDPRRTAPEKLKTVIRQPMG